MLSLGYSNAVNGNRVSVNFPDVAPILKVNWWQRPYQYSIPAELAVYCEDNQHELLSQATWFLSL